jgi:hypothetical protein
MGAAFDITVIGAECLDKLIFMENSPAYLSFSEEIVKILSDFNKQNLFGTQIDVAGLAERSRDTIINMHRAFLYWTYIEADPAFSYFNYLKLFCNKQEKFLLAANNGSFTVNVADIADIKERYIAQIKSNTEAFTAAKDFFAGYVYGYYFNYLTEQTVMRDYAELLVCIGIMSNTIQTDDKARMRILPRMSKLLENDRFKYISGELPLSVVEEIICGRYSLERMSESERQEIKGFINRYIPAKFEDDYKKASGTSGGLIRDSVIADAAAMLGKQFIAAPDFAKSVYKNCFDGKRTFLDGDSSDCGIYTSAELTKLFNARCTANFDPFYNADTTAKPDYALSGGIKGFIMPLICKSGDIFYFSELYFRILFEAIHSEIYVSVDESDLPLTLFPFAEDVLRADVVSGIGGIPVEGYVIRADKKQYISRMKDIVADSSLSDRDRKMQLLECLLHIISGNNDAESYNNFTDEMVFGAELFEEYIGYRAEKLIHSGLKNKAAKKALLDEFNKI